MKTLRALLVATLISVSLHAVQATTVIPPNFDELVGEAELIFQGTCTEVKSQWIGEGAQRHIVTYVTFKVEDALKGTPGGSYTIRMLGGTVDGTTMEVSDAPKFKVGNRDILFVEHNGQQFVPLVGIMHGRYRLERDRTTGRDLVLSDQGRAVSSVEKLGKDEERAAAAPAEQALAAADFKAAIKARLGVQR